MSLEQTDSLLQLARKIELIILDVDGVLTDGVLLYTEEGETIKGFNVKDGLGIKVMRKHGLQVAVITARKSGPLKRRMRDLGVEHFYPGVENKAFAFDELREKLGIALENIAYLGDDVIDLPVMQQVGLPMAVADAHDLVIERSKWVGKKPGGKGAVREACDFLLGSRMSMEEIYRDILESNR